jgi:hypothetical protein
MNLTFDITPASLITVAGGSAFVGLILLALRGVLKEDWTDKINRYATLIISVLMVEGIIAGSGTTAWFTYFIGFFVACQVTLAVLSGTEFVASGIVRANRALQARRAMKVQEPED